MNTKLKISMLIVIGLFVAYTWLLLPERKTDHNKDMVQVLKTMLESSDTVMLDNYKWYKDGDNIMGYKKFQDGHKEYVILFDGK